MKSSLTLLCLVVWVNVDASSAQTEIEGACIDPPVEHGFIVQANETNVVPRKIYYSCNVGFRLSTSGWWGEATCTEGKWFKMSKCIAQGVSCDPPPEVENAIVKVPYQNEYIDGFEVIYECRKTFEIEGLKKVTCENGNWTTPPPTCKQFCAKPEGAGTKMQITGQGLERYKDGQQIQYECLSPYKGPGGESTCKNGKWHMPIVCNISCPDPPLVINGESHEERSDAEGVTTEVSYQCKLHYTLSFKNSIQCLNGEWQTPPMCKRSCEIHTFEAKYHLKDLLEKVYLVHGKKKYLYCMAGYYHTCRGLPLRNIRHIEVECDDGETKYENRIGLPKCSYLDKDGVNCKPR